MRNVMIQVNGANIKDIGYYSWKKIVLIEFNNGNKYQYFDVPKDVYDGLLKSDSKGSFIHRQFKSKYRYCAVDYFEENLCYNCKEHIAECKAEGIKFGKGIKDDNVTECDTYCYKGEE